MHPDQEEPGHDLHGFVKRFQAADLTDNSDFSLLAHASTHLHGKLRQQTGFVKQLQLLYAELDKTHSYQELVEALAANRSLLREVFTLEAGGRARSAAAAHAPTVDWTRYGIDAGDYATRYAPAPLANECSSIGLDMGE
ncbi:LAMI_0A01024g1_1 [Lachancea mirantina]|uniref:LAMI_0A01024g1_1 n=1 Tax=Lachancea mirantina TaxID=1230905 RepID=A0A1G4IM19_9SACH|nr:LAMI_0A01024g1_1 [Lachancea mirantina]